MRAALQRLFTAVVGERQPKVDPLQTLELQQRLSRLATELRVLDSHGGPGWAAGHHVRAAQEAYERTLDDACRLAGIEVEPGRGTAHRLLAETELQNHGWDW